MLYSVAGSGTSVLAYKTPAGQVVTLFGQSGGDTNTNWLTQPSGVRRTTTTSSSTNLWIVSNSFTHTGGTAGNTRATAEYRTTIGSASAPATMADSPLGLLSTVDYYPGGGGTQANAGFFILRQKTKNSSGVTPFAGSFIINDETGQDTASAGPVNAMEVDLLTNNTDSTSNRRILSLVWKYSKAADDIGAFTITGGTGYTTATATLSGGGCSTQATVTPVIVAGSIVDMVKTGSAVGCTSPPSVSISGDGTGASATVALAVPPEVGYGLSIGPSSATHTAGGSSAKIGIALGGTYSTAGIDLSGLSLSSSISFSGSAPALKLGIGHKIGFASASGQAAISSSGSGANIDILLTPAGTGVNVSAGTLAFGTTGGPNITTGSGVPSSTQPKGSIYLRTGGSTGSTFYVSQGGGTWNAASGI